MHAQMSQITTIQWWPTENHCFYDLLGLAFGKQTARKKTMLNEKNKMLIKLLNILIAPGVKLSHF